MTDGPAGDDDAIARFRARSESIGMDADEIDAAVARARDAAAAGGLSLAEALVEESAEQSVHMGREG